MGGKQSSFKHIFHHSNRDGFSSNDRDMLLRLFEDLASHSITKIQAIDIATFLRIFKQPGMLGERLYAVFDKNKDGFIDQKEFMDGLSIIVHGTKDEKIGFLFEMYDLNTDGRVSYAELSTMLKCAVGGSRFFLRQNEIESDDDRLDQRSDNRDMAEEAMTQHVNDLLHSAFPSVHVPCEDSVVRSATLSFDEFKKFIEENMEILNMLEQAFMLHDYASDTSSDSEYQECDEEDEGELRRRNAAAAALKLRSRSKNIKQNLNNRTSLPSDKNSKFTNRRSSKKSERSFSVAGFRGKTLSIPKNLSSLFGQKLSLDTNNSKSSKRRHFIGEIITPLSVKEKFAKQQEHFSFICQSCSFSMTIKFCYDCGKRIATSTAFCQSCDRAIVDQVKHCPSCGAQSTAACVVPINHPASSSSIEPELQFKKTANFRQLLSSNTNVPQHMRRYSQAAVPQAPLSLSNDSTTNSSQAQTSVSPLRRHNLADNFDPFYYNHHLSQTNKIKKKLVELHEPQQELLQKQSSFNLYNHQNPSMRGHLWKVGRRFQHMIERYFILRDSILYQFHHFDGLKPIQTVWLEGSYIRPVDHGDHQKKMRYGIEISFPSDANDDQVKTYYARTETVRNKQIKLLSLAANTRDINNYYTFNNEIGCGKFSKVCICTHKKSGQRYAVKIIDRQKMTYREREALRTEIAVMKLVRHPNIVQIRNVYETKHSIYIVMNYVKGGDLFDRLKARRLLPEHTVRNIIQRLLGVLHYIHERGVVHRDLKPENIMVKDDIHDDHILVGDFGLSKFNSPESHMQLPCGTLAYVAPEILKGKGYGKEVDLWSVGVIMHVLLSGILPFDSTEKKEIVQQTLIGNLHLDHPIFDFISWDAKDLISQFLRVNISERITCERAMKHPWFEKSGHVSGEDSDEYQNTIAVHHAHHVQSIQQNSNPKSKPNSHVKVNTVTHGNVNMQSHNGNGNVSTVKVQTKGQVQVKEKEKVKEETKNLVVNKTRSIKQENIVDTVQKSNLSVKPKPSINKLREEALKGSPSSLAATLAFPSRYRKGRRYSLAPTADSSAVMSAMKKHQQQRSAGLRQPVEGQQKVEKILDNGLIGDVNEKQSKERFSGQKTNVPAASNERVRLPQTNGKVLRQKTTASPSTVSSRPKASARRMRKYSSPGVLALAMLKPSTAMSSASAASRRARMAAVLGQSNVVRPLNETNQSVNAPPSAQTSSQLNQNSRKDVNGVSMGVIMSSVYQKGRCVCDKRRQ